MNRLEHKVAIVTGAASRRPGTGNGKATAVFLASDEARWITGAAVPVDGGLSIVIDRPG